MVTIRAGAGGGITEGAYTSWTYKWNMAVTNGLAANDFKYISFYIDEINDIFYLWWYADNPRKKRFGAYNIADHSVIYESPSGSDYLVNYPHVVGAGDMTFFIGCHCLPYSILRSHQTYILLVRADYFTIEVWKAGALLWSRDIKSDTGEAWAQPETAEISLTGKYIMFWEDETVKLLLYEGT